MKMVHIVFLTVMLVIITAKLEEDNTFSNNNTNYSGPSGNDHINANLSTGSSFSTPGVHGINVEGKLIDRLFKNYNKKVRPVWNWRKAINVTLQMSINQFVDMDERNQVLTTNVWIEQHWKDEKIQWDQNEYPGILRIPQSNLWLPDITLFDNADSQDYVSSNLADNALVESDGYVSIWSKSTILRSTCKLDVKYFPFDSQQCTMKFGSWTYDGNQISLKKFLDEPDLSTLQSNQQWELLYAKTVDHVDRENRHDVTFIFGLKRKPLYYIYNFVMPCILLTCLSFLGFCMPHDVGVTKISLSVTLILSLTVFLLLVANTMPRTSEQVPLIGQYFAATMFLISVSTAMNVSVLNINEKGVLSSSGVPRLIKVVAFKYMAKLFFMGDECQKFIKNDINLAKSHRKNDDYSWRQLNGKVGHDYSSSKNLENHGRQSSSRSRLSDNISEGENIILDEYFNDKLLVELQNDKKYQKIEKSVEGIVKLLRDSSREKERAKAIKREWTALALVLDKAMLVFYILCTTVTTLSLLLQKPEQLLLHDPFKHIDANFSFIEL